MRFMSIFEVDCLCGAKVQMPGKVAVCGKCGRVIEIESWQVQYTRTAEGLLIRNSIEKGHHA
jgi:hypothetical protein